MLLLISAIEVNLNSATNSNNALEGFLLILKKIPNKLGIP
jgi:hypothetical protein